MPKPVILLAFANERQKDGVYLPNLVQELNQLKKILEPLEDKGICEVEILPSVTLDDLVAAFQREKYRGRIAIFHYSGHADNYELLLEEASGNTTVTAHGEGLVPFLANQNSLKFIFINGCFSARQAEDLVKSGIPVVIGTLQAVKDNVATELSVSFYKALAQGAGLEQAWKEATFKVQAKEGTEDRSVYYAQHQVEKEQTRDLLMRVPDDRFPWEIYYREGAEKLKYWNLPDAANDPYFGLPTLPAHYELPDQPYRFLERYTPKDAHVFFGRGTYIRDLYQRLTSDQSAPIIMLYGQSGVGKSSLLGAGVFPRIEKDYDIQFIRRDPKQGLLGALKAALLPNFEAAPEEKNAVYEQIDAAIAEFEAKSQNLEGAAKAQLEKVLADLRKRRLEFTNQRDDFSADLAERWRQLEEVSAKSGLLIILDQVEEVFTRPMEGEKAELDQFLQQVQQIFDQPNTRPKGKLLLAYRKEYDSELEKAFRQYQLPKEKVFLDKLDGQGIMEIINGLASGQRLRNKYHLEVEEGLPALVAENLLLDKDSAIAPVLQIILTKLWQQQEANDKRIFRKEDYQKLQEDGILLGDFFKQQMIKIREWENQLNQRVESSGLALDILNYHTTELGTAESRSLEDLRQYYNHQSTVLEQLIQQFKELYLLTDIGKDRTGLAHDTLAPIVQKEIKDSDKPGQRALRIIQTKVIDYERNPSEVVIDEDDLALVEEGADGMRMWMPKEQELVKKSQAYRAKQERIRQLNRRIKTGLSIAVAIFAVIATLFWYKNWKEARINRLMTQALENTPKNPTIGLKLAKAGFEMNPKRQNSIQVINNIYSENNFYQSEFVQRQGINALALSADGQTILTGGSDSLARLWSIDGKLKGVLTGHQNEILTVDFSPDGKKLATAGHDNSIKIWNADGSLQNAYATSARVNDLRFSSDSKKLVYALSNNSVNMQWLEKDSLSLIGQHTDQVVSVDIFENRIISGDWKGSLKVWRIGQPVADTTLQTHEDRILKLRFSPDGSRFASASRDATLILWDTSFQTLARFRGHQFRINDVVFSPDGEHLVTVSDDKTAIYWNSNGNALKTFKGHSDFITAVQFLPDGEAFITSSADGTIKRWPIEVKERLSAHFKNQINTLAVSGDGQKILVGEYALTRMEARIQRMRADPNPSRNAYLLSSSGDTLKILRGHEHGITAVALSRDDQFALTASNDGTAKLWQLDSPEKVLSPIRSFDKHASSQAVRCVAFSPDGQYVLTGSEDKSLILWSVAGDSLRTLKGHEGMVTSARFSPAGNEILSGSFDGKAILWNMEGEILQTFTTTPYRISQVDFSPDGRLVAGATWGGYTSIWEKNGRELVKIWSKTKNQTGHPAVHAVRFSPDGQTLATAEGQNIIRLVDLEGNEMQIIAENSGEVKALGFSPDQHFIYAGSADQTLRAFYSLPQFTKQGKIAELNLLQLQQFGLQASNFQTLLSNDSLELLRTFAYYFEKSIKESSSIDNVLESAKRATQLYHKIQNRSTIQSTDRLEAFPAFNEYGKLLFKSEQFAASIQQFEWFDAYQQGALDSQVAYALALYFENKPEKAKSILQTIATDEAKVKKEITDWLEALNKTEETPNIVESLLPKTLNPEQ